MGAFRLLIGLVFLPFCLLPGLPADQVISAPFFLSTVIAGLLVGGVNFALARGVVGTRLRRLAAHMSRVERQLAAATESNDWSGYDSVSCALAVDSDHEVGESAAAFNSLITTLARSTVETFADDVDILLEHVRIDLGLALSDALSHDRLQRLATLDPLTDAYNRRFGLGRLQEEFGRAVRATSPLGVLMVDLDHFKNVNDTYGHLVTDRVLLA